MIRNLMTCAVILGLAAVAGCSTASSNIGGSSDNKKEQFTIDTLHWKLPISVKKGNTTDTNVTITRGKDFSDTVTFKLEDTKKGLTFDPEKPEIKGSEKKIDVKIAAAKDADIGDHTITLTGTPKSGEPAKATFTVKVSD
jgi:hypothetical protein